MSVRQVIVSPLVTRMACLSHQIQLGPKSDRKKLANPMILGSQMRPGQNKDRAGRLRTIGAGPIR
jgi:hypothetical protein